MRIGDSKINGFVTALLLLVIFFVVTVGCEKEDNAGNNSIIGHWEWFLTIEPFPYTVKTPLTEGYEAAIKFESTDSVKYFKNATLTGMYPYKLKYRINNHLDPNSDSTLVLVVNNGTETFFSILNDTLILDQTYVDGPRKHYIRKQ